VHTHSPYIILIDVTYILMFMHTHNQDTHKIHHHELSGKQLPNPLKLVLTKNSSNTHPSTTEREREMTSIDIIEKSGLKRGLKLNRADIAYVMGFVSIDNERPESSVAETKRANDLLPPKSKFYATTAINYANGMPHMGHAYETITSDVVARYHRAFGDDTFFLTGSDEHGQKVAQNAAKNGVTPKQNCDKYVKGFQDLNKRLLMSNDDYIRTTDKKHYEHVAKMWRTSVKNGDIYLDKYEGWYSTRDEKFWTDTEAEQNNFMDGDSKTIKLVKMSEACYMFRMSKYHDRLVKHITENPNFVRPKKARKSLLQRLKDSRLRDLSVSRKKLKWGIPIPDDPEHVAYVWFDALNNYLSGIDYLVKDSKRAEYVTIFMSGFTLLTMYHVTHLLFYLRLLTTTTTTTTPLVTGPVMFILSEKILCGFTL